MTSLRAATAEGQAGLDAVLADPARALIATDFDGTLSPIVADPAAARAAPGAADALARLGARVGTVAIITGRPAAEAVALGGFAGVPGLIVLGHYGAERWQGGSLTAAPAPDGIEVARRALPGLLVSAGAADGTRLEDKGTALAVHTRQAPDPEAELARLREPLASLAAQAGLAVEPGRFVLELRPPGTDKGAALRALVASAGRARCSSAATTSATSRPSPRSATCGPMACPAARSPAAARSRRRWPPPPISSLTARTASCACWPNWPAPLAAPARKSLSAWSPAGGTRPTTPAVTR